MIDFERLAIALLITVLGILILSILVLLISLVIETKGLALFLVLPIVVIYYLIGYFERSL